MAMYSFGATTLQSESNNLLISHFLLSSHIYLIQSDFVYCSLDGGLKSLLCLHSTMQLQSW